MVESHLVYHFLFDHVRLWETGAVFVEIWIRSGTTVIATLELEVRVRRTRVWYSICRVEIQTHLILKIDNIKCFTNLLKNINM